MSDSELADPPASPHNYENEEPELPAPIPSLSLRGHRQYSLPTTTSILFSTNLFRVLRSLNSVSTSEVSSMKSVQASVKGRPAGEVMRDPRKVAIFDDDDDDDDEELNDTRDISTQAAGRRLYNEQEANSATLQKRYPQLENEEAYHGNATDSPLIEDIREAENVVDKDPVHSHNPSVARKLALQLRNFQRCQEEEHNFLHAKHLSNHEQSDVSGTCNSLQSIAWL
ncbi:hypothetical protein V502_02326 [Pseudogymnoascus sp. VKM F-4520 (FW-2644)]|nr:hypothetical protein V502_02326 [Pseudogymnoascus sp. VKM F-4520 (FW-2644)]